MVLSPEAYDALTEMVEVTDTLVLIDRGLRADFPSCWTWWIA